MSKISLTDEIFATMTLRGYTLARIRISGISSYQQIISALLKTVGELRGLATVNVRNSTQGWSANRALMLS